MLPPLLTCLESPRKSIGTIARPCRQAWCTLPDTINPGTRVSRPGFFEPCAQLWATCDSCSRPRRRASIPHAATDQCRAESGTQDNSTLLILRILLLSDSRTAAMQTRIWGRSCSVTLRGDAVALMESLVDASENVSKKRMPAFMETGGPRRRSP